MKNLRPAIKSEGKVRIGEFGQHHDDMGVKGQHGFVTPEGQFLPRYKAHEWVEENQPEAFAVLKGKDSMHTGNYYEALKEAGKGDSKQGETEKKAEVDLKKKTVFVFDISGLYTYIAARLADDFGTVLYYVPNDEDALLTSDRDEIGTGIKGVTRVHDIWEYVSVEPAKDGVDLFVFPDIGYGSFQCHLEDLGYRVFGSKGSEILESDKWELHKTLQKVGLPTAKTVKVDSLDELKSRLEHVKDKYLKVKWKHRGNFETFHHVDWSSTEPWFYDLANRVGQYRDKMVILIQDPIKSQCELAIDGWRIGGKIIKNMISGIECKDIGYAGAILEEMPEVIAKAEELLAPEFERMGYSGAYGNEIRQNDDGSFYLDATCRTGQPPGEIHTVAYDNYGEIVWRVGSGEDVDPEYSDKYVAHISLKSDWVKTHWLRVFFPKGAESNIKLCNYCIKDGEYWCIPDGSGKTATIGAAVGTGKTLKEACDCALKYAAMVEGYQIKYDPNVFEDIGKSIDAAKKYGVVY